MKICNLTLVVGFYGLRVIGHWLFR